KEEKRFSFKFVTVDTNYIEDKILGIGIKTDSIPSHIILFNEEKDKFINDFKPIFEDKGIEKIGHNLKPDIVILSRLGIEVANISFDTMIGEYLINPTQSSYSINNLSREYLGYYGVDEEALLGKGKSKKTFEQLSKE